MGLTRLPVWLGDEHACSYLPGRVARLGWIDPGVSLTQALYTSLVEAGCRRSGKTVYRPYCGHCRDCIPVRIPVNDYSPNRSQRRISRRNAGLRVSLRPPEFNAEHYELYLRYQCARHSGGAMAEASPEEYLEFLRCSWMTTRFIEFRSEARLVAVAVVDALDDGVSSVYTFFDPDESGTSLGIYTIMYQIRLARQSGLHWCYIGYWIADSRKMSYKHQFRPLEMRLGQRWIRFDHGSAIKIARDDVL